ncbi:MAG: murein transglycosylase A [Sphingomonadales bacterium]
MAAGALKHLIIGALFGAGLTVLAILLVPKAERQGLAFRAVGFRDLPGWEADDQAAALAAFNKSCEKLTAPAPASPLTARLLGGRVRDWVEVCGAAGAVDGADVLAARAFFEAWFTPLALSTPGSDTGQLTGYFEPIIEGRRTKAEGFEVPLYTRPPELVTVNLGRFRKDLEGRRVAGRVRAGRLTPFESRAAIEKGALQGRGLELMWLSDPIDTFFLHIQGSGRVRLADGSLQMVGYDGPNGHPYTSIGRLLVESGEMELADVSLQSIRAWLKADPERGARLMQRNASYIFFRLLKGEGPVGSLGAELTTGRSLAVDRYHLPLGAPVYLAGTYPDPAAPETAELPLERLLVAQDTGGAIRGELRGDVFWGLGAKAEIIAGHMNNRSRFFLLLPVPLAERLLKSAKSPPKEN